MRYKIAKQVLWKSVDDEIVIVDSKKDDYSFLNGTAGALWHLIEKNYSVDEIVQELAGEYDAPPAQIKSDSLKLLKELRDVGLIEEA